MYKQLNSKSALAEAVHVSLLKELNYLIICVDENNHVVESFGDTSRFLIQQNFNSNLVELLPYPLSAVFEIASKKVFKENKKTNIYGIRINHNSSTLKVNLSISPLVIKNESHPILMVIFKEAESIPILENDSELYDEKVYINQYIKNLEEETKELRQKLNETHFQLDSYNNTIQSFNTELLSANEEMQALNKELLELNTSYQLKNKELIEINEDLDNYFRSNLNGQLFVNKDLILKKFSPGTIDQVHISHDDIGKPLSSVSTKIKFETITDDIKQVVDDGIVLTKEIESSDGKWYQVMSMPYINHPHKEINGAIITLSDISELKKIQADYDQKNRTLQRINADLDHFVYAASHDLLGPLSNIQSSIQIINNINLKDEKLTDLLNIINFSVKKFSDLIKDISSIAKVEGDMLVLEPVKVEEVIDNVLWSLENKIQSSNTIIHKNLEVDTVLFSKKNLRSILYNLVSNAIKFKRDEDPQITIETKKQDDCILLIIKDNGIGIKEEDIESIFNMYGRLQQHIEGYGIGLFLTKKIIDATGGNIEVDSKLGQGTTFTIYLKHS